MRNLFLTVVLLSMFAFTLMAGSMGSLAAFFSLIFFITIGFLLFRRDGLFFFILSFSANILVATLLVYSNFKITNTPFLPGGDDKFYYEAAVRLSMYGYTDFGLEYLLMPYKLYIHTHGFYFDVLTWFGINDFSFIHSLLFNAFIGGTISVFSFKIIRILLLKSKYCKQITLVTILFPFTVYYSSNLLRECFLILFYVLTVYITIKPGTALHVRFILLVLVAVLSFLVRPVSAFFIASFPLLYLIFGIRGIRYRLIGITFVLALTTILITKRETIYNRDLQRTQEGYLKLSSEGAADNSLGLKLTTSSNPVLRAARILYIIYSPIPPPVFKSLSFSSLLVSVGAGLWYFIFPGFILLLLLHRNDPAFNHLILPFGLSYLISAVVVTYTTGDPRHLQPFYPMAVCLGLYYILQYRNEYKRFLVGYSMLIFVAVGFYAILKVF